MTRQASVAPCAPAASARMFAGTAAQARAARQWTRTVVAGMAGPDAAALAEAAVAELLANAVTHSCSGQPGGTVTVIITGGADGVAVHVHDLGAAGGAVPRPRDAGDEEESGRGLRIVGELSDAWGTRPAAECSGAGADRQAAGLGRCTWFACRPRDHDGGRI
jgi:anti-sigma regulatory factor (Ser/Thr protein kinase)